MENSIILQNWKIRSKAVSVNKDGKLVDKDGKELLGKLPTEVAKDNVKGTMTTRYQQQ